MRLANGAEVWLDRRGGFYFADDKVRGRIRVDVLQAAEHLLLEERHEGPDVYEAQVGGPPLEDGRYRLGLERELELVLTRYRVPAELVAAVKRTLDEGNTLLRQLHTDELVALARHHANRHREIMQWAPRFFADLASSHAKRGQEYADEAQRRARAGGAT
ncbi:MAG: hypothetical protein KC501_25080 [Myxococcales bacterium]|nr:hypothetical protein [Myxococcales bacterium]